MTVLYFTATGNSLAVAKAVGGNLISIPQLLRNKDFTVSDDVIGIIFPCFGMSIPRLVTNYLKQATLKADYIFAVVTNGGAPANSIGKVDEILKINGNKLDYGQDVMMMNNYLVWSDMETELAKISQKQIDIQIDELTKDIHNRKFYLPHKSIVDKFCSHAFDFSRSERSNKITDNSDKKFTVDDKCNGCGVCKEVCPVDNITIQNNPIFHHKCEHCLACIHNCQQNALHHKKEKSTKRFRNSSIKLSEIVNANK